jgi:large subunit ribosomal protein L10
VPRPAKVETVVEVREHLAGSAATLLTHYRGLTVKDLKQLRIALRGANAELRVVKNTLARRAAVEAGMEGLSDLLEGPTALVFCAEDPVAPAKAIRAFAKDHPDLTIRGGFLDGAVIDATTASGLADLASRDELLARMAGLLQAPLSMMARLLQAPLAGQARAMKALADKGGAPGAPAAAPAAAAPAAESAPSDEAPAAADDEVAAEQPEAIEPEAVEAEAPEAAAEPEAAEPQAGEATEA